MRVQHAVARVDKISHCIRLVRGRQVILDSDLAMLYGMTTKRVNEQVRRNRDRFPPDFMFQLTADEAANLRSQIATSSALHGGRRYAPFAFTEYGAIMAASVLSSDRAVEVSIYVVRAFVKLKAMLAGHEQLEARLNDLEKRLSVHDAAIRGVIDAVKRLAALPAAESDEVEYPEPEKPKMGFRVREARTSYRRGRPRAG